MALPQFESCCFCIPLRAGTLVIGYLQLIGSLFGIILAAFMIFGGALVTSGKFDPSESDVHSMHNNKHGLIKFDMFKIFGVISLAVGIILLILFIANINFDKPGHIKAYLIYSTVMLGIALILTVVSLIAAPSAAVISHIISYAIQIYFILVIRSHMINLQENPKADRAGRVYSIGEKL